MGGEGRQEDGNNSQLVDSVHPIDQEESSDMFNRKSQSISALDDSQTSQHAIADDLVAL